MSFLSLGLPKKITEELEKLKFRKAYPIQKKAIPVLLDGKDLLGVAKTGSGKTLSFALPILSLLQNKSRKKNRNIEVLVLVPTRELAVQVAEVFKLFSQILPTPIKTMAVYGGVSINPQMKALYDVNVLVATPGRLIELEEKKAVHLLSVEILVIDEADKILNLGFKAQLDQIITLLPKKRQSILFSATINQNVEDTHKNLLNNPITIKIESENDILDTINQTGYYVTEEKKGPLLRYLIEKNNLQQVLVFTSSVFKADAVAHKLKANNIDATAIHSKKSQGSRTDSLTKFKNGKLRVLIATDILARGIDISFLPCVINYELPRSPKDYIHRIGRTGRAEAPGLAISFVSEEEKHHFRVIQKKMKKWVDMIDAEKLSLF